MEAVLPSQMPSTSDPGPHVPPIKTKSIPLSKTSTLGQDKIQIVIDQVICNPRTLKSPYIQLRLGDQVYKTACSTESRGNWHESFLLKAPFHTQLFGTLQLDLFDVRTFLGDVHIGRAEIRLSLIFGLPDEFSSWYELWRRDESFSNMSEVRRRSALSKNVGAIQIKIRHSLNTHYHPDMFKYFTSPDASLPILTPEDVYKEPVLPANTVLQGTIEADTLSVPNVIDTGVSPISPRRTSSLSLQDLKEEESLVAESLEFLYQEEAEELPSEKPIGATFVDKLGEMMLSKETNQVIKSIRRALISYGQGLEMSNASLLSGIVTLEKFFTNHDTPRTGNKVKDLALIEVPLHYYKFAMAAYGWKGLNFFGKGSGIIRDSARKDADRKAALEYLRIPAANLLKFELNTVEIFRPSYFVVIDDLTNSLVLTIRGTMSATDTLTDLVCEYVQWKGGVVHDGVKQSAEWFFHNLVSELKTFLMEYNLPNLVLCGHSLGGATVSVLTMMIVDVLNQFKTKSGDRVSLKCYAFAPPPTVSLNLARKYQTFIDSFVVENDLICRLSYGHMMDLRALIVAAVQSEKRPSMWENYWATLSSAPSGHFASPPLNDIARCRDALLHVQDPRNSNIKLYLAGTVYFMYYENPSERPFASLVPRYDDLDIEKVRTPSKANVAPTLSTEILVENKDPPPMSNSASPSKSLNQKPLKRVIMERSDPSNFTEIILKRDCFLIHVPNIYDRAFTRAFETLMLDLGNPVPSLISHPNDV